MSFVNKAIKKILLVCLIAAYLPLTCSLNAISEVNQLTENHLRKIDIVESQSRSEQLWADS